MKYRIINCVPIYTNILTYSWQRWHPSKKKKKKLFRSQGLRNKHSRLRSQGFESRQTIFCSISEPGVTIPLFLIIIQPEEYLHTYTYFIHISGAIFGLAAHVLEEERKNNDEMTENKRDVWKQNLRYLLSSWSSFITLRLKTFESGAAVKMSQ